MVAVVSTAQPAVTSVLPVDRQNTGLLNALVKLSMVTATSGVPSAA